jgi:hypothetical protein
MQNFIMAETGGQEVCRPQALRPGPAFRCALSGDQFGQVRAFDDPAEIGGHHLRRGLRGGHARQFRILFQLDADEDQRQHYGGGR